MENRQKNQIISHLMLRTLIGAIGMALPILLSVGCFIYGGCTEIEYSLSDYYHSGVGDIFVGFLFVLGFFLLSYKGYKPDNIIANLGFLFALGVALFHSQSPNEVVRLLHFISAILLFVVFVIFSLYLFRKRDKEGQSTKEKLFRNKIYLICGIVMIAAVVGIGLSTSFLTSVQQDKYHPVFWLESLALWSFGFSWLVKGGVFWKDVQRD